MPATLVQRQECSVTIQLEIPLSRSMLDTEEEIQKALNEAGVLATGEGLKQFDTDGFSIVIGSTTWTSKGQEPKTYQTPYGEVVVSRHVYQSPQGGPTFCPLERDARIIVTSTPRFAKQVSHKYAEMSGARVADDLATNHGRTVSVCCIQDLADAVGSVAQAKEEQWHYATPELDAAVATVSVGLDGTCMLLAEDGYRQAMVGTVSLYDAAGERLHTIYVAAAPEHGKATFYERINCELTHVRELYPEAHYTGVADGDETNWKFLEPCTDDQCVDFHHATSYLQRGAKAASPRSFAGREAKMEQWCHRLKHESGAAGAILTELESLADTEFPDSFREGLDEAITYFRNQQHRMNYAERVQVNLPIGSGVTEAACKTIVKQRMCKSGAKWKERGTGIVLSLRTLSYTYGRWDQFWTKIDRYGFPVSLN